MSLKELNAWFNTILKLLNCLPTYLMLYTNLSPILVFHEGGRGVTLFSHPSHIFLTFTFEPNSLHFFILALSSSFSHPSHIIFIIHNRAALSYFGHPSHHFIIFLSELDSLIFLIRAAFS